MRQETQREDACSTTQESSAHDFAGTCCCPHLEEEEEPEHEDPAAVAQQAERAGALPPTKHRSKPAPEVAGKEPPERRLWVTTACVYCS